MESRNHGAPSIFGTLKALVVSLGYECIGVELMKESGFPVLRVYIDSIGGIGLDDCAKVSRHLNKFLDDNEEELPARYSLEVSSPGLERPLFEKEDYQRFIGCKVQLKFNRKIEGKKRVTATLEAADDNTAHLRLDDGSDCVVPFETITRAHLVYEGLPKGKKGRNI